MILSRPTLLAVSVAIAVGLAYAKDATRPVLRNSQGSFDAAANPPPGMTFIPGGEVTVGLSEDDIQSLDTEVVTELKVIAMAYPAHKVELAPYYIDTYEVTNRQWKVYLDAVGSKPSEALVDNYWADGEIPKGEEDRPVVFVSQPEATNYAKWCMKRLPTEFEWEFAARGPEALLYPWGNDRDDPDPRFDKNGKRILPLDAPFDPSTLVRAGDRANCGSTSGKNETRKVGSFAQGVSPFGLYDMAGNVFEWTSSPAVAYEGNKEFTFKGNKYLKNKKISGAEFFNSAHRVIRGGAFDSKGAALLSSMRIPTGPETWYNTIGFRSARSTRPGVDAIHYAINDIGPYTFRRAPINVDDGMQAMEIFHHNDAGDFQSYEALVFAPVKNWLDKQDRPTTVSSKLSDARSSPLPVGILTSTHDLLEPRIPAGTYLVAWLAADSKAAKNQKDIEFPDTGWNYPGLEIESRSSRRKKGDAKEEEETKSDDGSDEAPSYVEPEGSIPANRKNDALVLLNANSKVIATLEIDTPKEKGKPGQHSLERQKIQVKSGPPAEIYTFNFTLDVGRKGIPFSMPLRLEQGLFLDSPTTAPISDK